MHGGIVQSIAQALFEETVYDEDGQLLTGDAGRVPDAVGGRPAAHRTRPHRHAVAGRTRSASRASARPARSRPRAAVVNAAVDALSPLGIRHLEMPMQPARVWDAIRTANRGAADDPARFTLRARRLARRGARRHPRRREADRRRPVAHPDDASCGSPRPRRSSTSSRIDELTRHPPRGRRARDRRHDPAPRARASSADIQAGAPRRGPGRGRHRRPPCATAARSAARSPTPTRTPTCRPRCSRVGGSVTVRSASGSRTIAAADLVVDYLTTSLAEDELIVDVRLPADASAGRLRQVPPARHRLVDRRRRGRLDGADGWRVGITGLGSTAGARHRLRGGRQRRRLASTTPARGPARARPRSTTSTARPSTSATWRA